MGLQRQGKCRRAKASLHTEHMDRILYRPDHKKPQTGPSLTFFCARCYLLDWLLACDGFDFRLLALDSRYAQDNTVVALNRSLDPAYNSGGSLLARANGIQSSRKPCQK